MEAAFAPWNNNIPALSTRKNERHISLMIRVKNHWCRGAR